ncbi:CYTH-like domain superfamily [Sesbania bispinosa]|nr:CYTH-like domain superfamily [Sesbania bispinosa]
MAVLVDDVSRIKKDEEDLDPKVGRDYVAKPRKLGSMESRVLGRVKDEFGVVGENGFLVLGGFGNVRSVYEWKGLKLEVDKTKFDFGTLCEIECESAAPEKVKRLLEDLLKENVAGSTYGTHFRVTTYGESHGGGVGCFIDGCPHRIPLSEADMQVQQPLPGDLFFLCTDLMNTCL